MSSHPPDRKKPNPHECVAHSRAAGPPRPQSVLSPHGKPVLPPHIPSSEDKRHPGDAQRAVDDYEAGPQPKMTADEAGTTSSVEAKRIKTAVGAGPGFEERR